MRRSLLVAAAVMLAVATGLVAQQAPAADPLKAASDAMGVTVVTSLRFSGFGANFTVGQSPSVADPWPRVTVKSYEATYNFEQEGMRVDITREQGSVPPRGGGNPFVGEQRAVQVVRGNFAWDEAPPAPAGRRGGGPPPVAEAGRVTVNEANGLVGIRPPGPPPPTPQPGAVVDRMIQYWLEPHAFLRGAVANKAATRKVGNLTEVSYTVNGKYKLVGLINSRNEVEKISTAIDNPVLGDMPIEVTYSNYQRFVEGAMFPLRIVQTTGGHTSLDLWVSAVAINPVPTTFVDPRNAPTGNAPASVDLDIPANVRAATIPVPTVTSQQIGEGIHWITGGSHHSVAIEMRDHVILVEAPQNEARVAPVIAKVKELFPNKPIRFVVNTHHHFDHSGGLRTAVAEGATVVTHGSNRAFYQAAWKAPRTINPDKLAGMPARVPTFMNVVDRAVLTDTPRRANSRIVEIHRMQGSPHNDGFLMVYLPAEKLLIEADAYTPPAPPAAAPAAAAGGGRAGGAPAAGGRGGAPAAPAAPPPPNLATVSLLDNITRLKLDVAQIAPLHGARLATLDDVRTAVNPPAPAPAAPAAGRQGGGL